MTKKISCLIFILLITLMVFHGTASIVYSLDQEFPLLAWIEDDPIIIGEDIHVHFSHLPGNTHDWITIVPVQTPDTRYNQFFYSNGEVEGEMIFNPLGPGQYEVRVYFDYPAGGFDVQSRHSFSVVYGPYDKGELAWTEHAIYRPGEDIHVLFSHLPKNQTDWISIVPVQSDDTTYHEFFYTEGAEQGELTFKGLEEGLYEVRVYYDWPDGGYDVESRHTFLVSDRPELTKPKEPLILAWTEEEYYSTDQDIILHYENLPGNTQDWITIVPIDTPNDQYHEWFFTQGATEGTYEFSPLEAGEYEVRVYFDWPSGGYEVESKYTFTVID